MARQCSSWANQFRDILNLLKNHKVENIEDYFKISKAQQGGTPNDPRGGSLGEHQP
jgi:hypothetical protein